MANTINVTEMLECAVQIAKNGRDYYDLAAKNVKADRVEQVFASISSDEQAHIGVFEDMLRQVEGERSNPRQPREYADYLNALIEGNVLTQPKQGSAMARTLRNDKHALDLGFGFKKDSILFYYELRKMLPPRFHDELDRIITQEQDHITRISDLLKGFNKFGVSGTPHI